MLPTLNKNSKKESNPMPVPLYLHLLESAFLVSFTDPNNELSNVKFMFNFFLTMELVCRKYEYLLLF